MSRLGSWQPSTPEERLDRLESLAEIQQLPVRYALALDSRDMDMMVSLFTADVRVGREERGRDALAGLSRPTYELPMLPDAVDLGGLYALAQSLKDQGIA